MPVDFKGRVFMDILDILGFCWTQYQRTLSPPDTEKPALRGFFRIWRRERSGVGPKSTKSATTQPPVRNLGNRKCPIEQGSGSNRAKRAHETRHRRWMASPKGKRRSRAVIPLSPPDTASPAFAGFCSRSCACRLASVQSSPTSPSIPLCSGMPFSRISVVNARTMP